MPKSPSTLVTAAAIDHVRLSYAALDEGDLDTYASLLDPDVQLTRPGVLPAHGRTETLARLAVTTSPTRHELHRVVGTGDCITVTGRVTDPTWEAAVEFAEVITISEESLILGIRRYYSVSPH